MRKLLYATAIVMMVLAINACKPSKEKKIEEIKQMESQLISATTRIDSTKAQQLINLYISYADENKTDSLSPVFLFKAADVSMNIQKFDQSLGLLDRIRADYPQFQKIPDCIFLKAFIYENMVNDLKKADEAYKEFLSKYPNHELAVSAKAAIENLGIPAEDLIRSFEEKNKTKKDSIKKL